MRRDALPLAQPPLRGADSNTLLRLYDAARGVARESPSPQERARAERAVRRLAQELRKRNVPL